MFLNSASLLNLFKSELREDTHSINVSAQHSPKRSIRITWQGKFFACLLLLMFIGSMNYQNNLGILTSLFIGYCFIISGILAYTSLGGLQITTGSIKPVFAGERIALPLFIKNENAKQRDSLCLRTDESHAKIIDIPAQSQYELTIHWPAASRGRFTLSTIRLTGTHLLGAIEVGLRIPVNGEYVVYPRPVRNVNNVTVPEQDDSNGENTDHIDYAGQREYQTGDPLKHVNWKSFAAGKGLHTHEFHDARPESLYIDWDRHTHGDLETRLSLITRMLLDCEQHGQHYGLRMPNGAYQPGHGAQQLHRCLELVSVYKQPD